MKNDPEGNPSSKFADRYTVIEVIASKKSSTRFGDVRENQYRPRSQGDLFHCQEDLSN